MRRKIVLQQLEKCGGLASREWEMQGTGVLPLVFEFEREFQFICGKGVRRERRADIVKQSRQDE